MRCLPLLALLFVWRHGPYGTGMAIARPNIPMSRAPWGPPCGPRAPADPPCWPCHLAGVLPTVLAVRTARQTSAVPGACKRRERGKKKQDDARMRAGNRVLRMRSLVAERQDDEAFVRSAVGKPCLTHASSVKESRKLMQDGNGKITCEGHSAQLKEVTSGGRARAAMRRDDT
jgi:hypothetical protein